MSVYRAVVLSAAAGCVLLGCPGGANAPLPQPQAVIEPTRAIHLRAAFDDDPSVYVGRFVPDNLKPEEVDENSAAQTRCSQFFSTKVVNSSQDMDEVIYSSTKAAASVGIPKLGGVNASNNTEGRVRVKYTLVKRIQTVVSDPAGLDRCCKAQPDQCTGKIIGEFLMGSGEVYQYYGRDSSLEANGVVKAVSGNVDVKDSTSWKKVNTFKDMYFAFLTTAVSTGGARLADG